MNRHLAILICSGAIVGLVATCRKPEADPPSSPGGTAAHERAPSLDSGAAGRTLSNGSRGTSPSAGCDSPEIRENGAHRIEVRGQLRSYHLVRARVPGPVPLVLSFHGYGGSGSSDVHTFRLDAISAGAAVFLFPDGVVQDWYGGAVGWDTRSNATADIDFVRALIEEAFEKHCVDRSRVFAVGFSWGGWMAGQVACALDGVRGFVSVAGGQPSGQCAGPTSALLVHGSADPNEPLTEGIKARDKWRAINGCTPKETTPLIPECLTYEGCDTPLLWCQHPAGHELPSFVPQAAWDFLMAAP